MAPCSLWKCDPDVVSAKRLWQLERKSYQLSACVALHCLCLAITSVVVWSATLVACCSPVIADHPSSEATPISTARSTSATCARLRIRVRAIASQVADLPTSVATAAGSTTVQAQGGAICLDMAKTLAMVALLGCCRSVSVP